MLTRHEQNGVTWVDMLAPTPAETRRVMEEFSIPPSVAEELLVPTTKPRVEFHPGFVYAILHFPALRHSHKSIEQEIDFIVGEKWIITTHYDTVDHLTDFSKIFEVHTILGNTIVGTHAGFLFFFLMKRLYKAVDHEIDFVRSDLTHIDEHLFEGREVQMVERLSRAARDLLNLRQTIEPHRETLQTLERDGGKFFGEDFSPYLRGLANEYYRVHNHIMRSTEVLHELRETNNSLLSTKEGETMRVLTIMALLTFPLALLVSIFGIETEHNPIRGLPFDFWIIVGIVVGVGCGMLWYFKKRKWL